MVKKLNNEITGIWINEAGDILNDLVKKLLKKMPPVEIITTNGDTDWDKFLTENERLRDEANSK